MSAVDLSLLPALSRGSHYDIHGGMCVMEAVAYVAGEPWSDAPVCACPIISKFLRMWNDSLAGADRNRLLRPLIPMVIGTRSTAAVEARRAAMAADWLIRFQASAWLRLAGLTIQAETLEALPEVTDFTQRQSLMLTLISVRNDASAAWAAAGNAAWGAARDATRVAAWGAAGETAKSAVRDAAGNAAKFAAWEVAGSATWVEAGVAAETAAGDAAWVAAGDAAGTASWVATAGRDAAKSALAPTVTALQASALDLVHRMISVTETAT